MRIYGDEWTEKYRKKLISQGELYLDENGFYYLTPKGEERVLREISQYWRQPAVLILMEQWFAERFGIQNSDCK